VTGTVKTA